MRDIYEGQPILATPPFRRPEGLTLAQIKIVALSK
jgi:hypothetical protein